MNKHTMIQILFSLFLCHGATLHAAELEVKKAIKELLSEEVNRVVGIHANLGNDLTKLFFEGLIARNADIDHPDSRQPSALTSFAQQGNCDMARWLIERGADVNRSAVLEDNWVVKPVCEAYVNGHEEMVELLLDKGAQISDEFIFLHTGDSDPRCNASTKVLLKKWGRIAVQEAIERESVRQRNEKFNALLNLEGVMSTHTEEAQEG